MLSPITGHDRHPGVDRDRAAGPPPAAPDQARAGGPAADHRLHDARPRRPPISPTPRATTSASRSARTCTTGSGSSATARASSPTAGSSSSNIGGKPIFNTNIDRHNNPFGLNVITSGISISRPPRGNVYIGYSIIDTGPINTSALNTSRQLLAQPEVVWYVLDDVRLRQRDPAGVDVLVHPDRGRLPDHDRPDGRPAAATATCSRSRSRRGSARTSGSARASGLSQFDSRFAPTQ